MLKILTRGIAVMSLALIVAGSTSNVASAHHHSRSRVQYRDPVCYADGSCDVDGVCVLGVDCDGSVHHSETYYGTGHHGGHHH